MKKIDIAQISDAVALAEIKRAIRAEIRGSGPAPTFNQTAYFARAKHAENVIKQLLRKRPKAWRPPLVDADMLAYKFKPSALLDSLVPQRKQKWILPLKRRKLSEVIVKHFSLLDNPIETLETLVEVAESDAACAKYLLHFDLTDCEDIAPFVVLGLMRRDMTSAASGGRMSSSVGQVLDAVGLIRSLRMRIPNKGQYSSVWPLVFQEKEPGQADASSQAFDAQKKEKVTDACVEAIDRWLQVAGTKDSYFTLTKDGKAIIAEIFSELLDNAERHTIPGNDRAGGWHVAGFMGRRRSSNGSEKFVCHLCIISLGATIGESLNRAEDSSVADKLDLYCRRHRSKFGSDGDADDLLRTVCALQDRVSRVAQTGGNPHGGMGLMDMIDVVNELGRAPSGAIQPQVTIYSGTSCVLVRGRYCRGQCDAGTTNAPRTIWFNDQNSLEIAPDRAHVFKGERRFPGTIVSVRFSIDEQYLSSLGETPNDAH